MKNCYEKFSIGSLIIDDVSKDIGEETIKEGSEIASKEIAKDIAEESSHEIAEEAAKKSSKKSVSNIIKNGAKNTGKLVVKNPLKSAGIGIIWVSGAESLINKKKFSDVFGNNVKKTTDTLTPIVDDVVDAGVKSSKSIISSGEINKHR